MRVTSLAGISNFVNIQNYSSVPFGRGLRTKLTGDTFTIDKGHALSLKDIKAALDRDDNLAALKLMGYDAGADENGIITINGNVNFARRLKLFNPDGSFDDGCIMQKTGIDTKKLMKDVHKINGNLELDGDNIEELDGNLVITGYLSGGSIKSYKETRKDLFKNFIKADKIADFVLTGNTVPAGGKRKIQKYINVFKKEGLIKPAFKLKSGDEYCAFSGESKKFLEDLRNNLDYLRTYSQITEGIKNPEETIRYALKNGSIQFYGIDASEKPEDRFDKVKPDNYLYDAGAAKVLAEIQTAVNPHKTEPENAVSMSQPVRLHSGYPSMLVRRTETKGISGKTASAAALEALGCGSKADIIANTGLGDNFYSFAKYIIENDKYDLSMPAMRTALFNARKNNPAILSLKTGIEIPYAVKTALETGKISYAYAPETGMDFCIDLSDKKNLEYLRTIDDAGFQEWLDEKMAAFYKYKEENRRNYERFTLFQAPYRCAALADLQKRIEDKKFQSDMEQLEQIRLKRKKEAQFRRNRSLRLTLAWAASPGIREELSKNADPHIRKLIAESKGAMLIKQDILSGKITIDEAEAELAQLPISTNEKMELLSYYRKCWEAAGSDELKKGYEITRPFYEAYIEQGLDGIKNEKVRLFIQNWEKKHPPVE